MLNRLFQLSDIHLFIVLSCITVSISIIAVIFVRFIPLALRYKDNPVIGTISSLIGVIYGVLVGLMALYLINNINYAADAVQHEANGVANLWRDSKWLHDPAKTLIQTQIKTYIHHTLNKEWPSMQEGKTIDGTGERIIENIANELVNYKTLSNSESLLLHDMLDEVKALYDAREQRIQMSFSGLNIEIWLVILIGTILLITINYLLGMNIYLHIFTITAVALMVSSMIFLLVTLDRPFQGEFIVEPTAFQRILNYMDIK